MEVVTLTLFKEKLKTCEAWEFQLSKGGEGFDVGPGADRNRQEVWSMKHSGD